MASYEPLIVTAETPAGYVASDPWSPALDSILAYAVLREQLGWETFALGSTGCGALVEAALPLGREEHAGLWWWQCSMPLAETVLSHRVYQHRRADFLTFPERLAPGMRRIETKAGPFKQYRIPHTVRLAPRVQWHVIGDRADIERLLRRIPAIGARRGSGLGAVTRWTVAPGGDAATARLLRPLPEAFAREHGRDGLRIWWGIRPPGWAPEHKTTCLNPIVEG